jgi:hypothetical protein
MLSGEISPASFKELAARRAESVYGYNEVCCRGGCVSRKENPPGDSGKTKTIPLQVITILSTMIAEPQKMLHDIR